MPETDFYNLLSDFWAKKARFIEILAKGTHTKHRLFFLLIEPLRCTSKKKKKEKIIKGKNGQQKPGKNINHGDSTTIKNTYFFASSLGR